MRSGGREVGVYRDGIGAAEEVCRFPRRRRTPMLKVRPASPPTSARQARLSRTISSMLAAKGIEQQAAQDIIHHAARSAAPVWTGIAHTA